MMTLLAAMLLTQFSTAERVLEQEQSSWRIEYRFQHDGQVPVTIAPAEVHLQTKAWVSNSHVDCHGMPRHSEVSIDGGTGAKGYSIVIPSPEDANRCRERTSIRMCPGDQAIEESRVTDVPALVPITLNPGQSLRVRIRLEHEHCLYGEYDTLLGIREVELRLGATTLRDRWVLDREQYTALPTDTWPNPPADHSDDKHFHSSPDSLQLDAQVSGNQYYRYPERHVRYETLMRLGFWYFIAPGSDGECKMRVSQYRESPNAWKVLSKGGSEDVLAKRPGRWHRFDRVILTDPEATTLALDFRLANSEVGMVWIDDVTLEPREPRRTQP